MLTFLRRRRAAGPARPTVELPLFVLRRVAPAVGAALALPVGRSDNLRVVDDALRRGGDVALVTLRSDEGDATRVEDLWPQAVSAAVDERPAPGSADWPAGCRRIVLNADTGRRLRLRALRAGPRGLVGLFEEQGQPGGDPEAAVERVRATLRLITAAGDDDAELDPLEAYRVRADDDPLLMLYALAADVVPATEVAARQEALAAPTVEALAGQIVARLEALATEPILALT